jgi:hypothetical protein
MRLSLILLLAVTMLAACGKEEAKKDAGVGSGLSAEAISGNDVTAIDAVTGDAANMAADVDLNEDMANALENAAEGERTASRPSRPAAKKSASPAPAAASAPADDTAAANSN